MALNSLKVPFFFYSLLLLFLLGPILSLEAQSRRSPSASKNSYKVQLPSFAIEEGASDFLEGLQLDLKEPFWEEGSFQTRGGGVVWGENLRLQAQNIRLIEREGERLIEAWGHVLLFYHERIITADLILFNTSKERGELHGALIALGLCYMGAPHMTLTPGGGIMAHDAWISTKVPDKSGWESQWQATSKELYLTKDNFLWAKNIQFRLFKVPLLYLPSYRSSLQKLLHNQLELRAQWLSPQKARASLSWKLYRDPLQEIGIMPSYFVGRGPGITLDYRLTPPYASPKYPSRLQARAQFLQEPPRLHPHQGKRWRIKSHYKQQISPTSELEGAYDRHSDRYFTRDLNYDAFDQQNEKKTYLRLRSKAIPSLLLQARLIEKVNPFQTVRRERPTLSVATLPYFLQLLQLPLTLTSRHEASFLEYHFDSQSLEHLEEEPGYKREENYSCGRLLSTLHVSTHLKLPLGQLVVDYQAQGQLRSASRQERAYTSPNCTKSLESISPEHQQTGWFASSTRLRLQELFFNRPSPLISRFQQCNHLHALLFGEIELRHSTQSSPDLHYLFDLRDVTPHTHLLRTGAKLFHYDGPWHAFLSYDVTSLVGQGAIKNEHLFHQLSLKIHPTDRVRLALKARAQPLAHGLDSLHASCKATLSKELALAFDYIERSSSSWRVNRHDLHLLEEYRCEEDLASSGAARASRLAICSIAYQPSPYWAARLDGMIGGGEDHFTRLGISFARLLTSGWQLKVSGSMGSCGWQLQLRLQNSAAPITAPSTLL